MSNNYWYMLCVGGLLLLGSVWALYRQEMILINRPTRSSSRTIHTDEKKEAITLYFWKYDGWGKEKIELITSPNKKALSIKRIANAWLKILDEENLLKKKISIAYVLSHSSDNEVSICFDRSPFHKEMSSHDKLMWIEGLLKTIREAKLGIDTIVFTVHHKPLHDYHLDFSKPWPIAGYYK